MFFYKGFEILAALYLLEPFADSGDEVIVSLLLLGVHTASRQKLCKSRIASCIPWYMAAWLERLQV